MINSITVPKGTKVEYTVSKEGFIPSSDVVTVNEDKLIVVTLERNPYGDYWAVWNGGGDVTLYRTSSNSVTAGSPVKKSDILFNPIRMTFPTSTTSVTYIDGSTLTEAIGMFIYCSALTSVPLFDTSNVTDTGYMFLGCRSLTSVPLFDTSNVTNTYGMFESCSALTSVPLFDTSNVTTMAMMFQGCSALTSVPLFDTSNVTTMRYMFGDCTALETVPALDTSNVTNTGYMFYKCKALTSIPALDTSNVTNAGYMFSSCTSLTSIPALDISNVTDMRSMFEYCYVLENITLEGSLNVGVDFHYCTKLTYDSILSILTAAANTGNLNSKTLKFGRTIEDRDDELATLVTVCTAHGWTITGLTLK